VRKRALIPLLLLLLLLPAILALAANHSAAARLKLPPVRPCRVSLDGYRFDGIPSPDDPAAIDRKARDIFLKGGFPLARRIAAPRPDPNRIPSRFREEHALEIDSNDGGRSIRTGRIEGPIPSGTYGMPEGWILRPSSAPGGITLAYMPKEGRQSIVLVDPRRRAYLSISF
jgi:hypothetical protein